MRSIMVVAALALPLLLFVGMPDEDGGNAPGGIAETGIEPPAAEDSGGRAAIPELESVTISGPYRAGRLAIFLAHRSARARTRRLLPLEQAMRRGIVRVYEKGEVGELTIENRSRSTDVLIQAGDIVKGGNQDRAIPVDVVLAARSGRVPVSSFCVEHGRWTARAGDDGSEFRASTHRVASSALRSLAYERSQAGVWDAVSTTQYCLERSVSAEVSAPSSPSSMQLTLEHRNVRRAVGSIVGRLAGLPSRHGNAVGYAAVIGGRIVIADIYGSHELFAQQWRKLLDAAAVDAVAAGGSAADSAAMRSGAAAAAGAPGTGDVAAWLRGAWRGEVTSDAYVGPTRIRTVASRAARLSETRDVANGNALLHVNILADDADAPR